MPARTARAVTALAAGGAVAYLASRPSLMTWPKGIRPAVIAGLGVGATASVWGATGTAVAVRRSPRALIVRPAVALGSAAALLAAVSAARSAMLPKLAEQGRQLDAGFAKPPDSPLVSGGPGSVVPQATLGREGARFTGSRVPAETITSVTGEPPLAEAVRVFVGLDSAATPEERVALAMHELRRTGAFDRGHLIVESPAGSGFANPTPADVAEILTRGDCAAVAVGYGLLPSFLSLDRVPLAAHTQRLLLDAVGTELAERRGSGRSVPHLYLYGESLGARVQQAALDPGDLDRLGVTAALWVGTPGGTAADAFRAALGEPYVVLDRPEQLPHPAPDVHARVWFLEHDGDPVVRFRPDLLHRRPEWLRIDPRGRNVPEAMVWAPVVTWVQVLVDTLFATNVKPGLFDSRGHDYRADLGAVVTAALDLPAGPGVADRLEAALRDLEVARAQRIGEA